MARMWLVMLESESQVVVMADDPHGAGGNAIDAFHENGSMDRFEPATLTVIPLLTSLKRPIFAEPDPGSQSDAFESLWDLSRRVVIDHPGDEQHEGDETVEDEPLP